MKPFFKKAGWLLGVIFAATLLTLLFTGIIQTIMKALWPDMPEDSLMGISGTLGAGMAAIVLWAVIRWNRHLRFYRPAAPTGLMDTVVFIALIITVCRVVFPGVLAYLLSYIGAAPASSGSHSDEPLWQMILFGVILAPALEELLFRKDLFSLFVKRISMRWTIGLTALIFAAIHGYSLEGFLSCLMAGVLFAILMARTGSLTACVVAHSLCNLEALGYNTLERTGSSLIVQLEGYSSYSPLILAAATLVMGGCLLYLWNSRANRRLSTASHA